MLISIAYRETRAPHGMPHPSWLIDRWKPGDAPLACLTPPQALAQLPAAKDALAAARKACRTEMSEAASERLWNAEREVYYLARRAYPKKALADARAHERDGDLRELHIAMNRTLQAHHVTGDIDWLHVHYKIAVMVAKRRKYGAPSYFRDENR